MNREIYRYNFNTKVPFRDVEESLLLAVLAAESLHGRALVRLDASFCLDSKKRSCVVDAATDVGRAIARIFTGFLSREFGEEAFKVERVGDAHPASPELKATGGRVMGANTTTTYSMWSLFRNCRKACEWRYIHELVPLEQDHNLAFGTVIHQCLEVWHGTGDLEAVLDHIDRTYPNRNQDEAQKRDWHLAVAMMKGYASCYPTEEFDVVSLERTFDGKIINPATGASSRSFVLAGRVDGIVRTGDEHYLLEHKTASQVDADYLERLWTDFQIVLYSRYVEQTLGIRIAGVLYNILVKARLQQGRGETEAEYQARRAALIAKSKTGKTSAKRKLPESDDAFQERLAAKYAEPGMFHREMLYISRDRFETLQAELWELTQAFLDARRRGVFYQNTAFCFHYRRPCAYFPLCRSDGSPNVIDNLYRKVPPHEELREEASVNEAPAF